MKKLLLLAAAALALGTAQAQTATLSCCARPTASATEAFAMLASNEEFVGGHDAPLPYSYTGEGQLVEFKTADGQTGHGFEIKSAKPSNKYLFVYQEWWGLNDYIKKEAARFAQEMP
ncbi:MAG: dienelactone hydrolase family protein, partial [Hymenobacter sp.]